MRNYVVLNPLLKKGHVHTEKEPDDGVEEGILDYYEDELDAGNLEEEVL